jgi:hypothetical protein
MKIGPRLGWEPYTKFLASSHGECIMAMDAGTRNNQELRSQQVATTQQFSSMLSLWASRLQELGGFLVLSHPAIT